MSAWALISPASRGIGHALARELLSTTKVPVLATARRNTDQVKESILDGLQDVDHSRLHVVEADVLGKHNRVAFQGHPLTATFFRGSFRQRGSSKSEVSLLREEQLSAPSAGCAWYPVPREIAKPDRV